jgi:hypothetical protein
MFKVISPIERRDGSKFWMRCGSAFTNKDDSINVYLDAVPVGKGVTLQLRELTEEDLREREQRRGARGGVAGPIDHAGGGGLEPVPF